jgi:hypothetical protein
MAQRQPPAPKPARIGLSWWLLALALLAWNLVTLLPRGQPEVTIPYTIFVAQVQAGNVASVRVNGGQITGRFVHAFHWPPPSQSASSSATSRTASIPTIPTPSPPRLPRLG